LSDDDGGGVGDDGMMLLFCNMYYFYVTKIHTNVISKLKNNKVIEIRKKIQFTIRLLTCSGRVVLLGCVKWGIFFVWEK